ncbi:unnamed protein product [Protopolystoma xenopodis]|uniref:Uncharacterized protein n=1 Tax=Protopolystoma xenopodis TaxID=117903 RepID=A0A3S5BMZ3_9PLAT|nr:unnamed protein product [Protopolystoma xenopodis]
MGSLAGENCRVEAGALLATDEEVDILIIDTGAEDKQDGVDEEEEDEEQEANELRLEEDIVRNLGGNLDTNDQAPKRPLSKRLPRQDEPLTQVKSLSSSDSPKRVSEALEMPEQETIEDKPVVAIIAEASQVESKKALKKKTTTKQCESSRPRRAACKDVNLDLPSDRSERRSSEGISTTQLNSMLRPWFPTGSSVVRPVNPAVYRRFMEQRMVNVGRTHRERQERMRRLEAEMSKVGLDEAARAQMRCLLQKKESNHMRMQRAKMDQTMFKRIKRLGKPKYLIL